MRDTKKEVLSFWFDEIESSQWFAKDQSFDDEVKERFRCTYDMARRDLCASWSRDAYGVLALCLVLDQFPRNMFRDTSKAFETDEKALLYSKEAVNLGFDKSLCSVSCERSFLYMPFMHSESLEDQKKCVELFGTIKDDDPVGYDFAVKHMEVIQQFGRFPHRNKILGRDSSAEELHYLSQSDSGF